MNALSRHEQALLAHLIAEQEKRRRDNESGPLLPLYDTALPLLEGPAPLESPIGDQETPRL